MTQAAGLVSTVYNLPFVPGSSIPWRYMAAADHFIEYLGAAGQVISQGAHGIAFSVAPEAAAENGGALSLIGSPPATATQVRLSRLTALVQLYDAAPGAEGIEAQLDRQTLSLQEMGSQLSRTLKTTTTIAAVAPGSDGTTLIWQAGQIAQGPTADEIAFAQQYAEAAQLAAANAAAIQASQYIAAMHGVLPGGTNVSTALQTLIDTVEAEGGGVIRMADDGTYGLLNGVVFDSSLVQFIGNGGGQFPLTSDFDNPTWLAVPRTRFLALPGFPAGQWMFDVRTPADAPYAIHGIEMRGIYIDGGNIAQNGLRVRSIKHSRFEDIMVVRCTQNHMDVDTLSIGDEPTMTNADTQFNVFQRITVHVGSAISPARGVFMGGTTIANVNQNLWSMVKVVHAANDGILLGNCDSDQMEQVNTFGFGASGWGLRFNGDADLALTARNVYIFGLQVVGGLGVLAEANSFPNVIFGYSLGNGAQLPTVENGAKLVVHTETHTYAWNSVHNIENRGTSAAFVNGDQIDERNVTGRLSGGTTDVVYARDVTYQRGGAGTEYGDKSFDIRTAAGALATWLRVNNGLTSLGIGGTALGSIRWAAASIDLPSIAAGAHDTFNIAAPGIKQYDPVFLGPPPDLISSGLRAFQPLCSVDDVVTVGVQNITGAAVNMTARSWAVGYIVRA
jgi:hypothetical protein